MTKEGGRDFALPACMSSPVQLLMRMSREECRLYIALAAIALTQCGCATGNSLWPKREPIAVANPPPREKPAATPEVALVSHEAPVYDREAVVTPPADVSSAPTSRPITLPAVLAVVDQDNPTVALARERIFEAYAQWDRADSQWLPSLRAGVNYNKHEGRIQDVRGTNIETSRGAFYSGLGANAVGAGSPAIPGLYANFHLTDAIFQPQIAAHVAAAREANARATTNDMLLQAAQAYLELLRAVQEQAIAEEVYQHAKKLANLTEAYAKTGEGLESDFDRARTDVSLRANDRLRAEEGVRIASARLAQLLSLDPTVLLEPQEPMSAPIELVRGDDTIQSLVAQALSARPEVQESQALVCEAVRRLQRERYAPLIPSVLLGVSYGGFGAGLGGDIDGYADRFDADAVAWWELRNLGYGETAARREMDSRIGQAKLQQVSLLDQIAREVVEAHAQVELRRRQIDTAREAVTIARSSYAKNLDRIQNGQGLPLEALQAIQALGQAQREYLRAVTDYNLSQFSLTRALGQSPDSLPVSEKVDRP